MGAPSVVAAVARVTCSYPSPDRPVHSSAVPTGYIEPRGTRHKKPIITVDGAISPGARRALVVPMVHRATLRW